MSKNTVIGAKNKSTGMFECWALKDADYTNDWKESFVSGLYEFVEMGADEAVEAIKKQEIQWIP